MSGENFWEDMQNAFVSDSSIDLHLQGKSLGGKHTTAMRELTDKYRQEHALELPQPAGARVQFQANLGSVLTYDDIPAPDMEGTVVLVKTAMGKMTSHEDRVFVLWDDGKFRAILAEHLRPAVTISKRARNFRMVVADLGDLSGFFTSSVGHADELVHKATKDLWSFHKDGNNYVIERLFNDNGQPLKV